MSVAPVQSPSGCPPHIMPYHYGTFDAPNAVAQNGDPADVAALIEDAAHRLHVLAPGELFRLRGPG
jgi:hypothetical protein